MDSFFRNCNFCCDYKGILSLNLWKMAHKNTKILNSTAFLGRIYIYKSCGTDQKSVNTFYFFYEFTQLTKFHIA